MRRAVWALALLLGCASYSLLSEEQRGHLESEYVREHPFQYLKLSFYVTPFFGDTGARLLSDVLPDEVRVLDDTGGKPISPGKVERLLPAGTPVEIDKLEFPTSLAVTGRMVYTPRTRPWLFLHVKGEEGGPPLILVLRGDLKSEAEAEAEIARYLTASDPAPQLAKLPKPMREAIAQKHAVIDMTPETLEMAWGYPEQIHREFTEVSRKELWSWPGGERRAQLLDGRVSELWGDTPP